MINDIANILVVYFNFFDKIKGRMKFTLFIIVEV